MRQIIKQMNAAQQPMQNQQKPMQTQYPTQPWMIAQPQYQPYMPPPQHVFSARTEISGIQQQ